VAAPEGIYDACEVVRPAGLYRRADRGVAIRFIGFKNASKEHPLAAAYSTRLISVTVASIPLAIVNLNSTRWPGARPLTELGFASLKVMVIAGQFALATGPCEMFTVAAV